MGYTTVDNLVKRLPQKRLIDLAYDPELGGDKAIDNEYVVARLEQVIDDATAEIDGYLRKFTTVPISPVPDDIEKIAADLAIYFLYQRQGKDDEANPFFSAYKNAHRRLKGIDEGDFKTEIDGSVQRGSPIRSNALDDSGEPIESAFEDKMF